MFVFTTLIAVNQKPWFLAEHLARLRRQSEELGFIYPGDEVVIPDLIRNLDQQRFSISKIRLSVGENTHKTEIFTFSPPEAHCYRGVKVIISSQRVHPTQAHLKTSNRLPYELAKQEADEQGAFEALLLDNHGHVVDGTRTSPLLYQKNTLTLLEGGLDGITRLQVADAAKKMGIAVESRYVFPSELTGQLLLAGSGVGLLPVDFVVDEKIEELINHFQLPALDYNQVKK